MIIRLTAGQIKKILLYKMSYFPQPYTHIKNKIKAEWDLSNYRTESDLKNPKEVDTSKNC